MTSQVNDQNADLLRLQILKVLTSEDDSNVIKQQLLTSDGLLTQLLKATGNPHEVTQQLQLIQDRLNALNGWADFKDRGVTDWKLVRSAIEHENTLVHYRLTWLLLAQALFFALFGSVFVTWVKGDFRDDSIMTYIMWVLSCCSILAAGVSIIVSFALSAARVQLRDLDDWWSDRHYDKEQYPPLEFPAKKKPWHYISKPELIPICFLLGWLTILVFVVVDSRTKVLPFLETYKNTVITTAIVIVTFVITWILAYIYFSRRLMNPQTSDVHKSYSSRGSA